MRTIFQENQDDREAAMKKMTELRKETLAKVDSQAERRAAEDLEGTDRHPVRGEVYAAELSLRSSTSAPSGRDPPRRNPWQHDTTRSRDRSVRDLVSLNRSDPIIRRSRSWPGCAACRCRSRGAGRRGRRAAGAGRPPGAAGRPRARRGSAGRRRDSAASASSPSVPTAMTGPCRALTSSTLLSVLACSEPARGDEDARRLAVDQRDRAVLHLGGRDSPRRGCS